MKWKTMNCQGIVVSVPATIRNAKKVADEITGLPVCSELKVSVWWDEVNEELYYETVKNKVILNLNPERYTWIGDYHPTGNLFSAQLIREDTMQKLAIETADGIREWQEMNLMQNTSGTDC